MRIRVVGCVEAVLGPNLATEVAFYEAHPKLWPHGPMDTLFINGQVNLGELLLRVDAKLG